MWALAVGNPGTLKSPAMQEALKPLYHLAAKANEKYAEAKRAFNKAYEIYTAQKKGILRRIQKGENLELPEEPLAPACRRYIVNDATYEALGEILMGNPNGTLAYRDEMMSLIKPLDREDQAAARGLFLTAWEGKQDYTFDRIIRGMNRRIPATCLSMLGATQPGVLADYARDAINGGAGDCGMIQRFGLLVWPNQSTEWKKSNHYPDKHKRNMAWETFQRLDTLTPESVGAESDDYRALPCLRFTDDAQEAFDAWRAGLEKKLRSDTLGSALENHLGKYRKLVPTLALINHLASGSTGPVTQWALDRAIKFAAYLETHAKRVYGAGATSEADIAKAILSHIRNGDLQDGFTAREVYHNHWAHLSAPKQVQAGLAMLSDYGWLNPHSEGVEPTAKITYRINPAVFAMARAA